LNNPRTQLRQITAAVAVGAVVLNGVLFVQTAADGSRGEGLQDAIVQLLGAVFPAGGLRPGASPAPIPSATPHAVTGSS
jgi:hypothetical protein